MKCKMTIIVLLLGVVSASAGAQEPDMFGLGVMLGEPTGLSVKYWLDERTAIDGALAWSFSENDSLQIHSDYLIHDHELSNSREWSVYYGLGARLQFKDSDGSGRNSSHSIFGLRVPLGVSYLFPDEPMDLFFEVVPILDLSPEVELDLAAAAGLRFYF